MCIMCVCIHMHVYMHIYIYIYAHNTPIYVYMHIYICTHTHKTHIYISPSLSLYIYICNVEATENLGLLKTLTMLVEPVTPLVNMLIEQV